MTRAAFARRFGLAGWVSALLCCGPGSEPAGPRPRQDAGPPDGPVVVTELPASDGGACDEWSLAQFASSLMLPGQPCVQCHEMARGGARIITVGGTVFGDVHQLDDCKGVEGVEVVVTDSLGVTRRLATNVSGNFFTRSTLVAPFTVYVTDGTYERHMEGPAEHGDCNLCHSAEGAELAPGRIVAAGL